MTAEIPAAFLDLADCPSAAALTTVMPDGQPQTTVVWCDLDGVHVPVNTMRGFQKERNMRANAKINLHAPHLTAADRQASGEGAQAEFQRRTRIRTGAITANGSGQSTIAQSARWI